MAGRKKSLFASRELEYAKDYVVSLEGESIYIGPRYALEGDPEENAAHFKRNAVFSAAILALMVLCGFIRVFAMTYSPVVLLAYGIGLLAAFAQLVSCVRLARAKQPMLRRTFDSSFHRLKWLPLVSALPGAVAFIAAVVYDLTHREIGLTVLDGVFLTAQAAVTVMAVIIFLSIYHIPYNMIEPEKRE